MRRLDHAERRPSTRYRLGDRSDLEARSANTEQGRASLRRIQTTRLEAVAPTLLAALAAGVGLTEACSSVKVSVQAVHGRRQWDPDWRGRVDAALFEGRDSRREHGKPHTYNKYRCRCPECRTANEARKAAARD